MKIYIASHCKWAALYFKHELRKVGHEIISEWHDGAFLGLENYGSLERSNIALTDASQVMEADALVLIAAKHAVKGGKFVETGIALGQGKKVVVIGDRENMLIYHPDIVKVDTLDQLIEVL
jgi:nucleoside 2-deoxyribosyltransferase